MNRSTCNEHAKNDTYCTGLMSLLNLSFAGESETHFEWEKVSNATKVQSRDIWYPIADSQSSRTVQWVKVKSALSSRINPVSGVLCSSRGPCQSQNCLVSFLSQPHNLDRRASDYLLAGNYHFVWWEAFEGAVPRPCVHALKADVRWFSVHQDLTFCWYRHAHNNVIYVHVIQLSPEENCHVVLSAWP